MSDKDKSAQFITEQKFIADALKRYREAADAESPQRKKALNDLRFWCGEQWAPDIKDARDAESRPCLTMNKVADKVARVVNEQREAKPGIQISPMGSGSDVDTARVLEGLVRHIQNRSNSDDAYEYGYQIAVVSGKGYWRVKTEYCDDESLLQEIKICTIRNRFQVYYDQACESADYSDARYCFVVEDMPRELYREKYPNSQIASLEEMRSTGDSPGEWITKDDIRVAEYWHAETTWKTVKTGDIERRVSSRKVICSIINAVEKLEEYEWPGSIIPIVPVIANDVDINGRREVWGLVRFSQDPGRQYNYMASAATEAVGLAPKSPFIIAEGQVEGHEDKWQSANVRNWPFLEYKPVTAAGQPLPPPQRSQVEAPIQATMMMLQRADADMKDISGLQDPALGAPGPEQSSRAIVARQNQGAVSTLTYTTGLARAIKMTGRILMEIIPSIYDAPRVEKIVDPDGSASHVALFNSKISGMDPQEALQQAQQNEMQLIERIYDVGVGKYDIDVSSGPSFQSRRQEAATGMLTLVNSYPQIIPVAGDILVRNLDWPFARELADRMKKMLPPQLQDANDPQSMVSSLQSQLKQAQEINQQLTVKLQASMDAVMARREESESRERIAQLQSATQVIVQGIKSKLADAQAAADRDLQRFEMMHDSAHDVAMGAIPQQPPVAGASTPQAPPQQP